MSLPARPSSDPAPALPALALPVSAVMSRGVVTALAGESLGVAAARMSARRLHALAVEPPDAEATFRVLSDDDLLAALGSGADPGIATVGDAAATEPLTVEASATVGEAAQAMSQHGISHLWVVGAEAELPVGVISSTDIAGALVSDRAGLPARLRMVVAHNGAAGGDDAVALARQLAGGEADVLAAVVVPFPPGTLGDPALPPPTGCRDWEELCGALRSRGKELLSERAIEPLSDLSPDQRVILGDSPAASLAVLAEGDDPDLLVIGSSRRGPLGSVLLGSTGERIAHGSSVPVAIAPGGLAAAAPDALSKVAVGFDGRAESIRALRLGAGLASSHGAQLELISVVERQIGEFEIAAEAFDVVTGGELHDRRVDRARERAESALVTEGIEDATVTILRGLAAQRLLAASDDADLLVLGSRGYGPLARVMLGSVSSKVIKRASCAVVLAERDS